MFPVHKFCFQLTSYSRTRKKNENTARKQWSGVERRELILAILGRVAAVHTHLHSAEQQHPGHTKLTKRDSFIRVSWFFREYVTTTGGDVRHPQVFLVVTGHLVRKYGLACCVLDLVGKDGVPACSDGQAIGGTCQVTCVRRKDSERHAVLLHENLGACMYVNGLIFSFWLVSCGPYHTCMAWSLSW